MTIRAIWIFLPALPKKTCEKYAPDMGDCGETLPRGRKNPLTKNCGEIFEEMSEYWSWKSLASFSTGCRGGRIFQTSGGPRLGFHRMLFEEALDEI